MGFGVALGSLLTKGHTTKTTTEQSTLSLSFAKVIPAGFEPTTHSLEGCCSIQLSYGTIPIGLLNMHKKSHKY